MSSSNPPYPYYNGIPFNPSFFTSDSGSGLTEAQIATKFLRFPTGQGTETIPTLITNLITPTDDLTIAPPSDKIVSILPYSLTSGKIDLMTGTSANGSINMLTGVFSSGIIDMGGSNTTTNINGINVNIANTNEYGDTVNIMSGEYSYGTTNINHGIGNYGLVNIMHSENSDGEINIGQLTEIISPPTITQTTTNIQGNVNIGTQTSSSNTVNIGSESNVVSVDGGNVFINNTDIIDNTKNLTIGKSLGAFSTLTTINGRLTALGLTNINNSGTAGTNIGNVSSTTSIVGPININNSGASNSFIGNASSTTTIAGAVNINTSGSATTTIGLSTNTTTVNSNTINLGTTTSNIALGALTGGGVLTLNKPLTPMYQTVAIGVNNIGYTVLETLTLGEIQPYGDRNMFSAVTLPKGVWLIQCSARINSDNGSGTNINDYVFWCRDSIDYNARPIFIFGDSNTILVKSLTNSTSAIITSDGTTSYTIAFYMTYTNVAPNIIRLQTTGDYKSSVRRTRIA